MPLHEEKLTVIIPNYNYGKWIESAIDSVFDNYIEGISVCFIDDGSKDGSSSILFNLMNNKKELIKNNIPAINGTYKNTNMLINLIAKNESSGPSTARNIGIKYSFEETKYFMFLDSDDFYLKNKISKSLDIIKKYEPYIGCVYTDYINVSVHDDTECYINKEPFSKKRLLEECIIPCNGLVPKYVFEKIGFFDETMRVAEDYDFWIRMSKYFIGYHIAEPLSKIRVGKYNSTHSVSHQVWAKNWIRIREKHEEEF